MFLGTDCVEWIKKETSNPDTIAALEVGNKMIEHGVFAHCLRDHQLKDQKLFYRFLSDEKNKGMV